MPVRIKFLGGVGTVTGSSHLIITDRSRILLDAGLFHGRRDEFYNVNTRLNYNPSKLNAVIISHAHIDHCGNIPSLVKKGLRCKIYMTSATSDLVKIMLEDSGKIQEEDIQYLNKINRRLGRALRKPLYTRKEAFASFRFFRSLPYGRKFLLGRDVSVMFFDAGHILGSAIIVLELQDQGRNIRIGYAVDLGRRNLPLINDPEIPEGLDYLILESTYGGRLHSPIQETKDRLRDVIKRTVARGGKILIPSFAVERTQEVVYYLNELLKEKAIAPIPIYVDSPLAAEITEIFKHNPSFLDQKTRRSLVTGDSPFEFLNLSYIKDRESSKRLNSDKRPMIIIAGSGMCESGRILHHFTNNIEDSRNTVLVVGYMAKDTLGRKIVEKSAYVRIFGVEYELNAEVVKLNSFSGHADSAELMDFVERVSPTKNIFLVHGDEEQSQALFSRLKEEGFAVRSPQKDEEFILDEN